jgi:hypothetical protein
MILISDIGGIPKGEIPNSKRGKFQIPKRQIPKGQIPNSKIEW